MADYAIVVAFSLIKDSAEASPFVSLPTKDFKGASDFLRYMSAVFISR